MGRGRLLRSDAVRGYERGTFFSGTLVPGLEAMLSECDAARACRSGVRVSARPFSYYKASVALARRGFACIRAGKAGVDAAHSNWSRVSQGIAALKYYEQRCVSKTPPTTQRAVLGLTGRSSQSVQAVSVR